MIRGVTVGSKLMRGNHSGNDTSKAIFDGNWRLGNGPKVRLAFLPLVKLCDEILRVLARREPVAMVPSALPETIIDLLTTPRRRGSGFLKKWMQFLEDNADLRYPDISTLAQEV